jgi:hypothetical protein
VTLSTRSPRHHSTDTTRSRSTCRAAAARRRLGAADALTAIATQAQRPTLETRAIAAAERLAATGTSSPAARDGAAERRASARRARVDDAIVAQWLLEQVPRHGARAAA